MYKKVQEYFKAHPYYNSAVHVLIGVGLGILLTYPLVGAHPLRYGLALLGLGAVLHFCPMFVKSGSAS